MDPGPAQLGRYPATMPPPGYREARRVRPRCCYARRVAPRAAAPPPRRRAAVAADPQLGVQMGVGSIGVPGHHHDHPAGMLVAGRVGRVDGFFEHRFAVRRDDQSQHSAQRHCAGLRAQFVELLVDLVGAGVRQLVAGTTFLRARSPVTPKITTAHGAAIRGSRLSRLSRNGFCRCPTLARVAAGLIWPRSQAESWSPSAAHSRNPRISARLRSPVPGTRRPDRFRPPRACRRLHERPRQCR